MAITFGGDSISSDSSSLEKNVNRTINANGVVSGGQTVESFDSSGRARAAYRPWGMKHINNSQSTQSYWTYSNQTNPDGDQQNISGDWIDEATGRFTAPVSGIYQFGSHGIPTGNTGDTRSALYVNDSIAARHIITSQNGSHGGQTGHPIALKLDAGDYVNYAVYSGTGAHTGNWSGFSGVLIG